MVKNNFFVFCVIIFILITIFYYEKNNKYKYPQNTAGFLMTDKVPLAFLTDRVLDIENNLKNKKAKIESINYIYVVDEANTLLGTLSIKEIFRQKENKKVSELIDRSLVSVSPLTNAEVVAGLSLKHNIKSVPVVDENNKFLGVVLNDVILDIVYEANQEDISRLAGIEAPELIKDINSLSILTSLKHRLPWLIVGMFGGFLMSKTIASFESTLANNIILASFIPLIVYMGSAVQTQIGFFIVRDLAFNPKINFFLYAFRQLKVVMLIGLGISVLVFFSAYLFYQDLIVVTILSIAMFLGIASSIITGVFIPFIFHRLKFDPASASGPIATILQDLISIVIYLLVAQAFL